MKPATDPRAAILKLLGSKNCPPLDAQKICGSLNLPRNQHGPISDLLGQMERDGTVARVRKDHYVLPPVADLVTGKIQIRASGTGHVISEVKGVPDLFIGAEDTGTAMNGDRVVARISREPAAPARPERGRRAPAARKPQSPDRLAGRVIRVVERASDTIVGTLQRTKQFFYVVPDDPRMVRDVYVRPQGTDESWRAGGTGDAQMPRVGDKVVVRLDEWLSRHVNPEGEIVEVLGSASEPGVDMLSIIRQYDLPTHFPDAVQREADDIHERIPDAELARREDLRDTFIFTIDPDDARDFDDAIHVERTANGWHLGVHIADVSHFVAPGSALDSEARIRGNSVYLPDRVLPMLPERLSNGVCSLRPDEDHLTFSAFIDFTAEGKPRRSRFARTVIRSAARLTYKQAFAILDGKDGANPELAERVQTAWKLAAILRKNRFAAGSLDLDFPEVKVRLDAQGRPERLEKVENDISHQLIEEFMLAANESVARAIRHKPLPCIYRVHEKPEPEKLNEFRELAALQGHRAGDLTQRGELQKLLASLRGQPTEHALKVALLRSLKRARYSAEPLGHYGLAKTNYTHFTSPIRRYADLVVHRVLARIAGDEAGAKQRPSAKAEFAGVGELEKAANHISDTERNAAEAERDAVMFKKLEYFQIQLKRQKPEAFPAIVTDVRNFGMFVELPDFQISGMVHVSALAGDFYQFDAARRRLVGQRNRKTFALGDKLEVIVSRVDPFKQQIDFAPV